MNNYQVQEKFCKVLDAYIFTELYKRQTIKSKSFNFSKNIDDIRSKLMYIIKSLVIRLIKENEFQNVLISTTFSRNYLYVSYSLGHYSLRDQACLAFARRVVSGNNTGNNVNNFGLNFVLNDIYYLLQNKNNQVKNIKEEVDEILNSIFFIQNAVLEVGKFFKDIREAGEDYRKFKYLQYILDNTIYDRAARIRLDDAKIKLAELKELPNYDEILEAIVPLGEPEVRNGSNDDINACTIKIIDFIETKHAVYIKGLKIEEQADPVKEAIANVIQATEEQEEPGVRYITLGGERVAITVRPI
jgi:hypothetical protein